MSSGRAIVGLTDAHERDRFDCGKAALTEYLRRYARQNDAAGISRTFVLVENDQPGGILGYYSLAASSISFRELPRDLSKRLPKYPVPCALLARLAVDRTAQGHGLGALLLMDAYKRTLVAAESIGIRILVIHAKDDDAKRFYLKHDAVSLPEEPLHLIVDMRVIRAAVRL